MDLNEKLGIRAEMIETQHRLNADKAKLEWEIITYLIETKAPPEIFSVKWDRLTRLARKRS